MPQVKFDFYEIELPADFEGTFENLLQSVFGKPPIERAVAVNEGWVQLRALTVGRGYYSGIMVRSQTLDIPPIVSLDGSLEELRLGPDQGLGGVTHFYYRPAVKVVVLQRRGQGVRVAMFERFFQRMSQKMIELHPVVKLEALRRLRGMHELTKFVVKVSTPHISHYADEGYGINEIVELSNHFRAPIAEVAVSVGHHRGALDKDASYSFLRTLRRIADRDRKAIRKVIATGRPEEDDDERHLVLDLLQDKMVETIEVGYEGKRLSDGGLVLAVQQAYNRRADELQRIVMGNR